MNQDLDISPEFLAAFHAAAPDGILRFDAFMQLALYHPLLGYYRTPRGRIGYGPGTDFYTASTSGQVFGELVAAACTSLLGERNAANHMFIEVGAEAGRCVLDNVRHPFREIRRVGVGETADLGGPCIVFSNELFDAQPFRRFRYQGDGWREIWVTCEAGHLRESEQPIADPPPPWLPRQAPLGYIIDAPLAAAELAARIVAQPWIGLFIAFDYGKSWCELSEACPAGTARAYYRHTQSNDLLARPGSQDLTCHICWDWLVHSLKQHGFTNPAVETQEAFFIRHSESYIAPAIAADAARLTPRKQSLMQLLHGAHLGQKFQVLHGIRE